MSETEGSKINLVKKIENSTEQISPIYRGVWAERLVDSQELPVGGSLLVNEKLTTKLSLDFLSFDEQIKNFTEENIKIAYQKSKESFLNWLKETNSNIEPYIYFACYQVQQKIQKLLEINPGMPDENSAERERIYLEKKTPKLSELKGKTECAERASLGQYLLQKIGIESAYVSGISMQNIKDEDEFPENHSFIVLKYPASKGDTLIFDIARPRSQVNVPRVLETDVPFTYELLKNKTNLLVGATEVLQGGRLWFGVGEPVAGHHEVIEKVK